MNYIKDAIRFTTAAAAIAGFTAASHAVTGSAAAETQCAKVEVSIYFEPGEAALSPFSEALIEQAATSLKGCDLAQLNVTGYADASGDAANNTTLSEARAATVAAALQSAGIKAERTTVKALGEADALSADGEVVPMRRKTDIVAIPARGEFG